MPATQVQSAESVDGLILLHVGKMGHVGRFLMPRPMRLARGARVICRTERGLELGRVLGPALPTDKDVADGRLIRRMTPEDELLRGHLEELAEEAFSQCVDWLKDLDTPAVLLEVEPLMDGRTLYFHFLSDVGHDVQSHLDHLAAIYERNVRDSKFARLLEHGCGPGCGTAAAKNGCGSGGSCAVCKVACRK
jgi:hypothetical protein